MYQNRKAIEELVKSLKSDEKQYFSKIHNALNPSVETPLYIQLFRLLENGESELQEKIAGTSVQSLTIAKKRLYKNILKSLRLFHQDGSVNQTVHVHLSDVENLYSLGLASQALIPLKKAADLVYRYEKFGYQFQALDWEKRLNIVLKTPTRSIEDIRYEEETILQQLNQIQLLEGIYAKIMAFKKQYGFAKGSIMELVKNQTIASQDMPELHQCLSKKAVYYYNFINAIYYWMVFDHEKGYSFSQKLIFDDNASILPNDYLNGVLQHITSSVCMAKFEDTLFGMTFAQTYIEKFKLNQSPVYSMLVFAYQANYRLVVNTYMGNKQQITETIRYVLSGIKKFEKSIPLDMMQTIQGNLMIAYMAVNNYNKVDEVWNGLFNRQSKEFRRDVYADLYLFRLFSLLHQKRYELLTSASLSATRFFEKSDGYADVEYPISLLLLKERNYESVEVLNSTVNTIKGIILDFIVRVSDTIRFQEHYSKYAIWCDAIENDEPFYKAAKNWYNRFLAKTAADSKR